MGFTDAGRLLGGWQTRTSIPGSQPQGSLGENPKSSKGNGILRIGGSERGIAKIVEGRALSFASVLEGCSRRVSSLFFHSFFD
jgi:hypothetical protein